VKNVPREPSLQTTMSSFLDVFLVLLRIVAAALLLLTPVRDVSLAIIFPLEAVFLVLIQVVPRVVILAHHVLLASLTFT